MKRTYYKIVYLVLLFCSVACATPLPGTRLWDISNDTFDKVCTVHSTVNIIQNFEEALDSKIDKIAQDMSCSPTVVTEVGIIATPGSYCLANDLSGTFTINAPRVTLDMNGKRIMGGIQLLSNASEVVIKDGYIDGNNVANGIDVAANLHDLRIDNMHISDAEQGISIAGLGSRISITDTLVVRSSLQNLSVTDCSVIWIENSVFNSALDSASSSASLASCEAVTIFNSSFSENGTSGLSVIGLSCTNCSDLLLKESRCRGNGGNGLSISSCSRVSIKDCELNENLRGLLSQSNNCLEVECCSAKDNTFEGYLVVSGSCSCIASVACSNGDQGFRISSLSSLFLERCSATLNSLNGFDVSGASVGLVKECFSVANSSCGFNNSNPSSVVYGANVAQGNGNNYCQNGIPVGLGVAPYSAVAITGAAFWDNISA